MKAPHNDVLLGLLADRALEGLDAARERELEELLAKAPEVDREEFDRAAAALHLAWIGAPREELPPALVRTIERAAGAWVRPELESDASAGPTLVTTDPPARRSPFVSPWPGWLVAAASLLLFLFVARRGAGDAPPAWGDLQGVVEVAWSNTEDPLSAGVSGAVRWDPARQRGVMRFRGLPPNEPTEAQYQLWIFDAERDEARPVDGGVFDVPTSGEVDVPIDAKLAVADATLFAVTLERPGGVVVSDRSRLVLAAPVP